MSLPWQTQWQARRTALGIEPTSPPGMLLPPKRVIVSNVGIRDKELPPVPGERPFHRTFYTMTARGGGLPSWSTQIGSFNRARLTNMLHFLYPHQLARGGNWTARQLAESILAEAVLCRTLAQELRAHEISSGDSFRLDLTQEVRATRPPRPSFALRSQLQKHLKNTEFHTTLYT